MKQILMLMLAGSLFLAPGSPDSTPSAGRTMRCTGAAARATGKALLTTGLGAVGSADSHTESLGRSTTAVPPVMFTMSRVTSIDPDSSRATKEKSGKNATKRNVVCPKFSGENVPHFHLGSPWGRRT